jgi:CelD/BcsL family acetyltransferase involved in cellulose biosynthesis
MPTTIIAWQADGALRLLDTPSAAAEWNRLNAERGDLPFLRAAAVSGALKVFGTGKERLFTGRRGTKVVAMFVLAPAGALRWQTFQPSQIPLGSWVADAGLEVSALSDSLIDSLGLCLALSITQIDPRFAPRGVDTDRLSHGDYIETGWIDVDGSFDEYWAARGKNLRQNMRKQRNKLAADGVRPHLRVIRDAAEMADAIARYGALESTGWKAGEGTAIHPDNSQGRFYRQLFETAAAAGEAVVYEYLFDERTVAMNLCLLRAGVLVVLKTTYDESIKSLSPAFLLREEELHLIFSEHVVRRIEYYGRLMEWHTKLTQNKRMLYHLTRYRWAWVKQLATSRRKIVPVEAHA